MGAEGTWTTDQPLVDTAPQGRDATTSLFFIRSARASAPDNLGLRTTWGSGAPICGETTGREPDHPRRCETRSRPAAGCQVGDADERRYYSAGRRETVWAKIRDNERQ